MSRPQLNPRRREALRGREACPVASLIREHSLTASGNAELAPVKVRYDRKIRSDWSEPGQDGFNLSREVSDLRSRPDLLDDRDKAFLRMVETSSIRGPRDVFLSPVHQRRLANICHRYTSHGHEAAWRKRQADLKAALEPTSRGVEFVNERGVPVGDVPIPTLVAPASQSATAFNHPRHHRFLPARSQSRAFPNRKNQNNGRYPIRSQWRDRFQRERRHHAPRSLTVQSI